MLHLEPRKAIQNHRTMPRDGNEHGARVWTKLDSLVLARNFSPMWLSRHSDLDFEGCAHEAKFAACSDGS
jgi:hypothetical protein